MKNRARKYAIDFAILIGVIAAITLWQSRNLTKNSTQLSGLELTSLDGNQIKLTDKKTVIFIFAPWCQVCHACIDNFDTFSNNSSINVIGVAFDYESIDELRSIEANISFPITLGNDSLRRTLNFDAYPTFYILNQKQEIVAGGVGYTTWFGLWWRLATTS